VGGNWRKNLIWLGVGLVVALGAGFGLTPYFKGFWQVNPVALWIGAFPLYWYGVTMAAAVLAGVAWLLKRGRRFVSDAELINIAIWAILGGIIGARLLFVILKLPDFIGQPWWNLLNLHSGGLSIHGALIGGLLGILLYVRGQSRPNKWLYFRKILDLIVPSLILGQIIGRIGNFFNQEAFGGPTNLPWRMFVAPEFRPVGFSDYQFFHPTFLYSIIGLLIVLVIILMVERRFDQPGRLVIAYLIAYSAERFVIEFFRIDSDRAGILTWAQWASLVLIMIALVISLIWRGKLTKKT
jgi:phosphatidylglycerol:prolipoprotein diacylglycerol transferase